MKLSSAALLSIKGPIIIVDPEDDIADEGDKVSSGYLTAIIVILVVVLVLALVALTIAIRTITNYLKEQKGLTSQKKSWLTSGLTSWPS